MPTNIYKSFEDRKHSLQVVRSFRPIFLGTYPLFPSPILAHDLNAPDGAFENDDLLGSHFDEQLIGVVPPQDAGDGLALCRPDGDLLSHELRDELVG